MTAFRRKSVFGLAVLLMAATAAADTVVSAKDAISCSAESADARFVGLRSQAGTTPDMASHIGPLDTLPLCVSPTEMAALCRRMDTVLRRCGLTDDAIDELLHEVRLEALALGRIWPLSRTWHYALGGGVLGGAMGCGVGQAVRPAGCIGVSGAWWGVDLGGTPVGTGVGCAAGSLIGAAIGIGRRGVLVARHRDRINDLIRRVNRAVAEP
jgi:hypothetical protein